jgi:hypothetical protein
MPGKRKAQQEVVEMVRLEARNNALTIAAQEVSEELEGNSAQSTI